MSFQNALQRCNVSIASRREYISGSLAGPCTSRCFIVSTKVMLNLTMGDTTMVDETSLILGRECKIVLTSRILSASEGHTDICYEAITSIVKSFGGCKASFVTLSYRDMQTEKIIEHEGYELSFIADCEDTERSTAKIKSIELEYAKLLEQKYVYIVNPDGNAGYLHV